MRKLFVVGILAIAIHDADASSSVAPEEDLRVSQICGIMPNTKRSVLTGDLDVFSLTAQVKDPKDAFAIQMFDRAFRTRNKYSRVYVPHDANCMFATQTFKGANVYLANLTPDFPQAGVYNPNDTVIGSLELLGILTKCLDQTLYNFQHTRIENFLLDMIHTTQKEALCSSMIYFARDYGLNEDEIEAFMPVWALQISLYDRQINEINSLLSQYQNEQYATDISQLIPSVVPYIAVIQKLNNSHPFGNPVRADINTLFMHTKYKDAIITLCGYPKASDKPGYVGFSASRIILRKLPNLIDIALLPLESYPEAYTFVRDLILGYNSDIVAKILDRFIDGNNQWLESYMAHYESILESIEKFSRIDTEIKQMPQERALSLFTTATNKVQKPYIEICNNFYGGESVLGYMTFKERTVRPISDQTPCFVYQIPIGQLAQKIMLSADAVQHIQDKTALLVQRTDAFGPGTRYFSAPELEILNNSLAEKARLAADEVINEYSEYIVNEEENISDNTLIFISEHFDETIILREWAQFQKYTRPISKYMSLAFKQFGQMEKKPYRGVKALFSGLDILG